MCALTVVPDCLSEEKQRTAVSLENKGFRPFILYSVIIDVYLFGTPGGMFVRSRISGMLI